jgi:Fe-S oxidoreductase
MLIAYLPHYAPLASRLAPLMNLRDRIPGAPWLTQKLFGLSARRSLPRWSSAPLPRAAREQREKKAVLLIDTFTRYFEPENAQAAVDVLEAAGYELAFPAAGTESRPLCCGRTFLAAGLVQQAKLEAARMLQALKPYVERGIAVVGLEPSCLLTLRDEYLALGLGAQAIALSKQALLFEEFIAAEVQAGRLQLDLAPLPANIALLHGHCHQKAFDAMPAVRKALGMIPGLQVQTIESSCCGMAGSFGYEAEHFDASLAMAEAALLPAVRRAPVDAVIIADGTSCRHQIQDGSGRRAWHVAQVLQHALRR